MTHIVTNLQSNKPHEILEFNGTKLSGGFHIIEQDNTRNVVFGVNKYQFAIGLVYESFIRWIKFYSCLGTATPYNWEEVYTQAKSHYLFSNLVDLRGDFN